MLNHSPTVLAMSISITVTVVAIHNTILTYYHGLTLLIIVG